MKKTSRGTGPRNHCTNFEDYRSIFRHRSEDTFVLQTHRLTDSRTNTHFSYQSFRCPEGLKCPQKKFQLNRRKSDTDFGYQYLRNDRKYTFLNNTPINKIVLEWSIYYIETIKNRFGSSLNFTSKNCLSPILNKCNISKVLIFSMCSP